MSRTLPPSANRSSSQASGNTLRGQAPRIRNSQYAYKEALAAHARANISWLDLGCGHQLLPDWMPGNREEGAELLSRPSLFVGIDGDMPSLVKNDFARNLVAGNVQTLPFGDETFDLVTANMVVEHVPEPLSLMREVRRVLKPGGEFLFHTPNVFGYTTLVACVLPQAVKVWLVGVLQGRKESDIFPTYYRMNSSGKIRDIAEECGLEVADLSLIESSAQLSKLGLLAIPETLWIRMTRLESLRGLRTNLIVALRKRRRPVATS